MGMGGDILRGMPGGSAVRGPSTADQYDTHAKEREEYARRLREQAGKYDPAEYGQYLGEMRQPVDEAFQRTAAGTAAAYGSRGLSASPVAGGTMAGFAGKQGVETGRIQAQAAEAARKALRGRTLDQYGALTDSWGDSNRSAVDRATIAAKEDEAMWNAIMGLGAEAVTSQRELEREREREERRAELLRTNGYY
jgi:hypothetical protein